MGVPPFLLTATLEAILAQRLVRKICKECREQTSPSTETLAQLDLTPDDVADQKFYRGRGCAACNNTGFKGRTGLFEYLPMNDQLRDLINHGASTQQIRDLAMQTGMVPLAVLRAGKSLCRGHHHRGGHPRNGIRVVRRN